MGRMTSDRLLSNFTDAWQGYLSRAQRLEQPGVSGAMQQVDSLLALKDSYDYFVLDATGVLSVAGQPLPGMPAVVAELQSACKVCVVLTNAGGVSGARMTEKFAGQGYRFIVEEIVSSRDTLADALRKDAEARRWHWGVSPLSRPWWPQEDVSWTPLEAGADWSAFDAFALQTTLHWQREHSDALLRSLQNRPRPVWCANPDTAAPSRLGMTLEPGALAEQCAAIAGVQVRYFGKPFPECYALLSQRLRMLGVPPGARGLMVGDSPHTDILGAHLAGLDTALMPDDGLLREQPLSQRLQECGIYPDYVIRTHRA